MHEQPFPPSDESPEQARERAVAALRYEEEAGLGFRRTAAMGHDIQPYGEGSLVYGGIQVPTSGQILGSYLASIGLVFGVMAIFYKPLLLCTIGVACAVGGIVAGGQAERIGRWAFIALGVGFFLGMIIAITFEFSPI